MDVIPWTEAMKKKEKNDTNLDVLRQHRGANERTPQFNIHPKTGNSISRTEFSLRLS